MSSKEILDVIDEEDNFIENTRSNHKSNLPKFPVDINISKTEPLNDADPLKWYNFDSTPLQMKILNNGHTIILNGKWNPNEHPYIHNEKILHGSYKFSQLHIHWGRNDMEGSEHTIDGGCHLPGEIHVVTFNNNYRSHESALKETDGIVIICYLLKLQNVDNPGFSLLISDQISTIIHAHETQTLIPSIELIKIIRPFDTDFFMYHGLISSSDCSHQIQWLISRYPIGVSIEQNMVTFQMNSLRFLLDDNGSVISKNFRVITDYQEKENKYDDTATREQKELMEKPDKNEKEQGNIIVTVFHVLPSSSAYSTLLPIPEKQND